MLSNEYKTELIVDLFAGGGGASTGITLALGREPDIAINHDPEAISVHTANHPHTRHFCSDVFEVDPLIATSGRPVGLLWASPDCKHFSKAKGGKPVDKRIRSLAWVVIKWARAVSPRVICLENVEEFQTWGPLGADNKPCPQRKGKTFSIWKEQLRRLGYAVEHRELRACDYGAPTTRKRLFVIARRDGLPIVWPQPTHAKPNLDGSVPGGLLPWRTAADCIDFALPCPSIFERKKPLAYATCRRIAKGIVRYVLENPKPFIVQYYSAKRDGDDRTADLEAPLPTQSTENRFALVNVKVSPLITEFANASNQRNLSADEPLRTQTAQVKRGHFAVVSAFLAKHYTGVVGSDADQPVGTVTAIDHHSLVTTHLVKLRNNQFGQSHEEPLPTLTAGGGHVGEVRAFLVKYYGTAIGSDMQDPAPTVTSKHRLGLVTVTLDGEEYVIADIGLRMLTPGELYKAQGFPDDYVFETGANGERITKTAQVRMVGNSVCPPIAKALIACNYAEGQFDAEAIDVA